MSPLLAPRLPGPRGFTLVELLITVVVAAVLAAIALPFFGESVRKSRRSEAMTAIAAVQQAQERWRSNHAAYTTDLEDLGLAAETPSGYYAIAVAAVPGGAPLSAAYMVTAWGQSGTSQADDRECRRLGVLLEGGNLRYAGCGSCNGFADGDFRASHACWAQ